VTSSWTARFPDLTGKAAIVATDSPCVVEVVRGLAANGVLVAIVAEERSLVDDAVRVAEALDVAVLGMTADPSSAEVWERVAPHIEQRLGPIDIAVAIGSESVHGTVRAAVLPDMAARQRGVVIVIGPEVVAARPAPGVRHRGIAVLAESTADDDVAAAVLLCASDSVRAAAMTVQLS
jgi:hypothetical protein